MAYKMSYDVTSMNDLKASCPLWFYENLPPRMRHFSNSLIRLPLQLIIRSLCALSRFCPWCQDRHGHWIIPVLAVLLFISGAVLTWYGSGSAWVGTRKVFTVFFHQLKSWVHPRRERSTLSAA